MKCIKCNMNDVPTHRKTKCDPCAKIDEASWDAKQNPQQPAQPVQELGRAMGKTPDAQVKEFMTGVKAETGTFQSTVWNHSVAANSYEVGTAVNRFKLYFETPADLKTKMQELRDAGLMDLPLEQSIVD